MDKDVVNIKGTRYGLVICLDTSHDFDDLKLKLKTKIEAGRGFFRGAKFVFHLGTDPLSTDRTRELEDICSQNGLIPDQNIIWPAQNVPESPEVTETPRERAMAENVRPLLREASPSMPSAGLLESDNKPCLMVHRSLRSGQKINYSGNVVVIGDVNPGSEVTAAGDIVVMGSLRGVVHAGANGDQKSIIMAYRLNPVQLRIGSVISRPPENSPVSYTPEIARLQKGQMFIEPYLTHGLK